MPTRHQERQTFWWKSRMLQECGTACPCDPVRLTCWLICLSDFEAEAPCALGRKASDQTAYWNERLK